MKKLWEAYNRQNKGMKVKVLLCIMLIILMLTTGCINNNKENGSLANHVQNTDSLRQTNDSSTIELSPTALESAKKTATSIWNELSNDMVCVENDTGSFYICKYEVTQKLWREVMGDNPSDMQGDDLPVENVNWNDCQSFIPKLNELTGKRYRLPTEVEWEYACRGGKYSKGYKYSGSNDLNAVAWYDENSDGKTHPVGQKQPNELGLYDMSGNVWEWCQDMQDGTGMCRGGSWIHNARNCDPSLPNETPRAFCINSLGLRLAL